MVGVRGLRGGLEELTSQYAENMEDDLDWAIDWSRPDDDYSRLSSKWVGNALMDGMTRGATGALNDAMSDMTFGLWPGGQDGEGSAPETANIIADKRGFISTASGGLTRIINYSKRGMVIVKNVGGDYGRVSIRYNRRGFPDFSDYVKHRAYFRVTGDRAADAARANLIKFGRSHPTPKGWVWHHHQNMRRMELIPQVIHDAFRHTGGAARAR